MATNEASLLSMLEEDTNATKEKSPSALRTISEASEALDVPQHVLRFWETKFTQIKPLKRNGGRRFYRPQDLDILQQIKHLLYAQGYTIKGAQKAIADYVATRSTQKSAVVTPLHVGFAPAHGNDNMPEPVTDAQPEQTDILAELAQALSTPEPVIAESIAAEVLPLADRAALLQLRDSIMQARDALAQRLAVAA